MTLPSMYTFLIRYPLLGVMVYKIHVPAATVVFPSGVIVPLAEAAAVMV